MLQVLRTPPTVGFSGNPLNFSLAIVPWRPVLDEARNMQLTIAVLVENEWDSDAYTEAHREILTPDGQGFFNVDVSLYVDAHLQFFTPNPAMRTIAFCPMQSRRYRIIYSLADNTGVLVANTTTAPMVAVKGGYADTYLPGNHVLSQTNILLTTALVRQGNPLYNRPLATLTYVPHELRFAYFLVRTTGIPAEEDMPAIEVQCTNPADNVTHTFEQQNFRQWQVFCIPLTLPIVLGTLPDSDVTGFTLNMQGVGTENLTFRVDDRPLYDARTLLYRDSVGGLNTITLRGDIEWQHDHERQTMLQVAWPDRFAEARLRATQLQQRATTSEKAKGYTGFLLRAQLDAHMDLFSTEELYEYIPDYGLLPCILLGNKARLYSNSDSAFAAEIEWERALETFYHSPLPYPAQSCPALTLFVVRQASRNTLEFLWSIPQPYFIIQVDINNGSGTEVYQYAGNTGRIIQPFTNPVVGSTPETITVRGRILCNPHLSPPDAGPYTIVDIEVVGNLLPIAVPDTVTINSGYNTPIDLPVNVLENDYDPDGDAIECVPLTEAATAQGGALTLALDGTAQYLPPSETFVGNDSITYTIRETNLPTLQASALLTIIVQGNSTTPQLLIYLRIVELDVVTTNTSSLRRTTGKRFIYFYSNAAGTQALDLTGLGISIEVTQTRREETIREAEDPLVDEEVTVTTYTGIGIRQLLHDGVFLERRFAGGEETRNLRYTHVISPSAQYIII